MIGFDRRALSNFGWTLICMTLVLLSLALTNLYSASYQLGLLSFKKHLLWVSIGLVAMISVSFVSYKFIQQYSFHFYVVFVLLLVLVLFVGKEVASSKSWISLGSFGTVQPSEFVKIPIIFVMARLYSDDHWMESYGFVELLKPALVVLVPFILVLLQPDLGTALIILLICGSIILFMGVKKRALLFILVAVVGLSYPTWQFFLKSYQKERIEAFIDPFNDPLGSGYNAIQSQIAIGSGKLTGKGFKSGAQTQLRFLPARHTDFAFSVLAEEWGFLGAISLLLLYFLIILWILDTASRAKDRYSIVVSFGVAAMLFWHVIINVGMVLGILPIIGVPLLIFSYGGSSTLTAMIAMGVVLGIRRRRFHIPDEVVEIR